VLLERSMQSPRHWTKGEVCLGVRRRPAEDGGVGAPPPAGRAERGSTWTSSLSGFCTRACFPRIGPASCANDGPLETVANRSVPMACGPNVDQAAVPVRSGLSSWRTYSPRIAQLRAAVTCRPYPSFRSGHEVGLIWSQVPVLGVLIQHEPRQAEIEQERSTQGHRRPGRHSPDHVGQ
jgi:hypothetical protein